MKSEKKSNLGNNIRQILDILSPFPSKPRTIFSMIAKGDIKKEEKVTLIHLKTIHSILMGSVLIAIITLTIILPSVGFKTYQGDQYLLVPTYVIFYIFCSFMVILGYFWPQLAKRFNIFGYSVYGLFMNHISRLAYFEIIVLLGFAIGLLGGSWFAIAPLFITGLVAFILTYPSDKKWAKLSKYYRSKT